MLPVDTKRLDSGRPSPDEIPHIPGELEGMEDALKTMLDTQIGELERRIESVIAQEEGSATKASPRP